MPLGSLRAWGPTNRSRILKLICLTLIVLPAKTVYPLYIICYCVSLFHSLLYPRLQQSNSLWEVKCANRGKLGWSINLWDEIESENVSLFLKGNFHKELVPLYIEQTMSLPLLSFTSLPHPLLSSLQYNNSNYVQTTKHASSNDSTDMGKLANLHNNKCGFEPIKSPLTFKWYKNVISKVCAYPGWLSAWMCREWSKSHAPAYALHSTVQHWQPRWQCFVIGVKSEMQKRRLGEEVRSTQIRMAWGVGLHFVEERLKQQSWEPWWGSRGDMSANIKYTEKNKWTGCNKHNLSSVTCHTVIRTGSKMEHGGNIFFSLDVPGTWYFCTIIVCSCLFQFLIIFKVSKNCIKKKRFLGARRQFLLKCHLKHHAKTSVFIWFKLTPQLWWNGGIQCMQSKDAPVA